MRHLRLAGGFEEIGREVGKATRVDLPGLLEDIQQFLLCKTGLGTVARMRDVALRYLDATARCWTPAVAYLQGMADGGGVTLEELSLAVFSEEIYSEFYATSRERCSTVLVRTPAGPVIAHNEDYEPHWYGRMVCLEAEFKGWPRMVCMTYPGMLPCLAGSLNASGLATLNNALWPVAQAGLSKQVLHFRAALSEGIDEAVAWLAMRPTSVTSHYLLAHGPTDESISLTVANPTAADEAMALRTVREPVFVHTNHVLPDTLTLTKPDPAVELSPHSFTRYKELRDRADRGDMPRTPEALRDLFSTNDGLLHRTPAQNKLSVTLATVIIRPRTGEFWIRDADPSAERRDWHFTLGPSLN